VTTLTQEQAADLQNTLVDCVVKLKERFPPTVICSELVALAIEMFLAHCTEASLEKFQEIVTVYWGPLEALAIKKGIRKSHGN